MHWLIRKWVGSRIRSSAWLGAESDTSGEEASPVAVTLHRVRGGS